MKQHLRMLTFGVATALILPWISVRSENDNKASAILLRHTEGSHISEYLYTLNQTTAHLQRLGEATNPPSPWNLIDRQSGKITILRPHNQSVTTLASDAFDHKPEPPREIQLPPGYELPPQIAEALKNPGKPVSTPTSLNSRIGPDPALLPDGATLPEIPETPAVPTAPNPPPGIPGGGLPAMPPMILGGMPPIGGMDSTPLGELIAHEKTKGIQGHTCQRHTMMLDRGLELELWLTTSKDLPPFHLLLWDGPPHFGGRNWLREWPHAIRKAGKFPLLAALREKTPDAQDPSPEISRWEIISIQPATPEAELFHIPDNYLNTDTAPTTP